MLNISVSIRKGSQLITETVAEPGFSIRGSKLIKIDTGIAEGGSIPRWLRP